MSNLKQQSIQKTLNIQIGIVILSIGIIIGILFFLFSVRLAGNEFQNNIDLQTKHLSDTFTQQLWLFDLNTTQQLCNLAVESPEIIGLRLLDPNKNLVVERGVFQNDSAVHIARELRYENDTLVGYIELLFVNTFWKSQRDLIFIAGICMIAFTITASFLMISILLNRHLAKPLKNLQNDMISLTAGKFKKSKLYGQKTEIQNIIDVFNQMSAALARREESQQEVEYQLTKEKIFIEALIHTLPGVFYVFDEGQSLVRWNKNFEIVAGLTREEMALKSPEDWVAKKDQPLITKAVQKALTEENVSLEIELQLQDESIPYFLTATNFTIEGKKFLLGVGIDLTKRKELEKALRQAYKMESIGALAGGIAHDFNNILFPISGYVEMLMEDLDDESPFQEYLKRIQTGVTRSGELVKQILIVSRQAKGERSVMRVQTILKEVIKLSRASIPATIKLESFIDNNCGPVFADPTQIHQIAMNLITNAYHAIDPETGTLGIQLKEVKLNYKNQQDNPLEPGTYICLTITDTGVGMDSKIIEKIFDPYFTTKKKGKGTGLGLSIVYGIVKSYDGDIHVQSIPGEKTSFKIYLPRAKEKSENSKAKSQAPVLGGNEHILVVDDEESIILMLGEALNRQGYKVTTEKSSLKALELFRVSPEKFDLVITDMTMPDMTGDQLTKELKSIRKNIPIIICTGYSEKIDEQIAKTLNINAFLMKPVNTKELALTIRQVFDSTPKMMDKRTDTIILQ